jgi:hypothetical protein
MFNITPEILFVQFLQNELALCFPWFLGFLRLYKQVLQYCLQIGYVCYVPHPSQFVNHSPLNIGLYTIYAIASFLGPSTWKLATFKLATTIFFYYILHVFFIKQQPARTIQMSQLSRQQHILKANSFSRTPGAHRHSNPGHAATSFPLFCLRYFRRCIIISR